MSVNRIVLIAALACVVACKKDINNEAAVRAAIQKRVEKTGFTLDKMGVNVTRVTFHDDEAQATVSFVPKGGPPDSGVTFKYNLRRDKDEWVVTGPATGDSAAGHTGMGAQPGVVPPGQVDPSAPLPAGHSPIGSKQ